MRHCQRRRLIEGDEASEADKIVSRSFTLSSTALGVIAKLDIAEAEDGIVTPVDYKRGKRPHVAQGFYEPERIQICLQALLLEEHGYRVEEGAIYYAESRERVRIALDDALRMAARTAVSELRLTVSQSRIPPPLKDSPFVKNVLKPRFLREIMPTTQFNYPIDTIGEWRAGRYRFLQRFRSDVENRIVEEFDAPFARIDYIGPDRFDIYWMRHTGAWWPLHRSVTLDDALNLMIDDGRLHPV